MLQKEVDEFREDWNNHRIRKSTMAETLGGIPEFLYFAPTHCGQLLQFCTYYYASILNLYMSEYVQVLKTIFVMLIGIYLSLQNYAMQNFLKVFAWSFRHLQSRLCSPTNYMTQVPGRMHYTYS